MIRRKRSIFIVCPFLVLFASCAALRAPLKPPSCPSPTEEKAIDRGWRQVNSQLEHLVREVDDFFGDPRLDEEYRDVRLSWQSAAEFASSEGVDGRIRISGRYPLPVLERRLSLFFGRDREFEDVGEVDFDVETEDPSYDSGLVLSSDPKKPFSAGGSLGTSWQDGVIVRMNPYVRYRNWHSRRLDRITQYLLYDSDLGFGSTTRVESDYLLKSNLFIRVKAEASFGLNIDGTDLVSGIYLRYKPMPSYGTGLEWETHANTHLGVVEVNQLALRYRRSVFRPWLEVELAPLLYFRNRADYKAEPAFQIAFRITFARAME